MTDISDIYETRWPVNGTFAEPLASDRFADMFATAEKQQRLVNNAFAEDQSREAAYDRRIAAVKAATGQELENPERGGYSLSERDLRRLTRDGPINPMAWRRAQFEQRLAAIREAHPDKTEALTFDDINAEARVSAKAAEDAGNRETGAGFLKSTAAELAGGVWGSRRDPLFVGSLFAGPTSAAGKSAFTRIASASLFQGLYNAGLTAVEQPAVQNWRAEIGARSGVQPALENVGMAFLFGAIPGAVIQGGKEALALPLRRVLGGHPEPGDLEAIHAGLTPDAPREAAALAAGAESVAADRATLTIPEPKGVEPELHNDMLAAALKRADDVGAPSPEAIHAIQSIEAYHGSPHDFEAFSTTKIGAGEGAQAYGHGLYFAEHPEVADTYRDGRFGLSALSPDGPIEGNLYRVRIHADRDKFLDYDKVLTPEQREVFAHLLPERAAYFRDQNSSPTGQSAYDELTGGLHRNAPAASERLRAAGIPGIKYLDAKSRGNVVGAGIDAASLRGTIKTQEEYIASTLELLGQSTNEIQKARFARHLAAAKDKIAELERQASEAAESTNQGTRNFVLFDDKDVEITHKNGKPVRPSPNTEIEQRVAAANPKSEREAIAAADEALDDIGRREGAAVLRDSMDRVATERETARAERLAAEQTEPAPKPASKDPIGKIPWVDDEGRPKLLTPKAAAAVAEKDDLLAMLVRSCK